MRKRTVIGSGLLALVLAGGLTGTAQAAAGDRVHHWGPVQSKSGHGGYAKADVWLSDFRSERFVVSGKLYDRDGHSGHCAYMRVRFHYKSGGTGWSQVRYTCSTKGKSFKLSSDGEVTRADVRVCLVSYRTNGIFSCYTDPIKASTVANWPR